MKKLFSVLLLVFSIFFLVSCEDFGKKDNGKESKEAIVLTSEEVADILSEVDLDTNDKEVFSLETSFDLQVNMSAVSEELDVSAEVGLKTKGQFNLYADIEEFETSYIYINLEFSYEFLGSEEDFKDLAEFLGADLDDLEEFNFNQIKKASFVGNIYIIAGVAYLDLEVKSGGTTVIVNQYEEIFTEEEFNESKAITDTEGINVGDFDLEMIPEQFELKTYKVGDSYQFELWLIEDLSQLITDALEAQIDEFAPEVEVSKSGAIENYLAVKFSDVLERLLLVSEVNLDLAADIYGIEIELSVKSNLKVDLDFSGKLPANLPKVEAFADYEEGINLDIFN